MLLKRARIVHWKQWTAEHECEEFKEGVLLEPIQAMLRRKTNEWTDKQRHVVEGGWVQKRMYDEMKCQGCERGEDEGTEKHSLYHCPFWREVGNQIPEGLADGKEVLRRILSEEAIWEKSHLSVRRWESGKHRSWSMPVEGFRADGSLLVSGLGQWCSWIMMRRWGHCMGRGALDAEFEAQRTIKRAGLKAFFCLLRRTVGPTAAHVDNQ